VDSNNDNKPQEQTNNSEPQNSPEPTVQQSVEGVIPPQQTEPQAVNITKEGEITDKPIVETPLVNKEVFEKAVAEEQAKEDAKNKQAEPEIVALKKRVKKLKVWLAVLVILLVAVGSALAVYFYTQSQVNSDLEAAQAENAKLSQELAQSQTATTDQAIATLNSQLEASETENDKLEAQVAELQEANAELIKIANDLKTKCGTACSSVQVPQTSTTTQ
jgi:chromosome segregation ATPase